ncbi:SigE family RNA polymerase sigma factor [Dactylosporangium siamense]|uniref:RNA polymerase n=1 Tax=Dactylosporangium siamense TaxID=685454 RepID=A0A919PU71_9ACTN|nr:SigE family RNA polymerase sigma factor [Dactylosporangium siamense]GIG48608.1 RNA polymerase [Dactylosporangium siamense]
MQRDENFSAYAGARWPALVRSAVLLGCTVQDAEDLAQTALMRCYVSWAKVMKAGDRDAYVYRILVNAHHDSRRRRWWGEKPAADVPERAAPDDATGSVDTADTVRRALSGLSRVNREVIVLRYYAHLSDPQIAEALGIAPGTVKSRAARALTQLSADANLADLRGGAGHA